MKILRLRRVIFAMRSTPRERLPMLRVEGRIANHDREFEGAIEINTETGLIELVGPRTGKSDLDLVARSSSPALAICIFTRGKMQANRRSIKRTLQRSPPRQSMAE